MRAITSTTAAVTPAIEIGAAAFLPDWKAALEANATGYYRVMIGGVIFYDLQRERIGGVNRHGCMYASGMAYGQLWHNYADIKGVGPMGYGDKCRAADCVMDIWRQHFPAVAA